MDEDFFGKTFPTKLLEVKAMRIAPEHRTNEAGLMRSRWFDYRDMHPALATYLYAHHYQLEWTAFYEQVVDIRTVAESRAFQPADIFMSRDMTSMWLARGFADSLGIPYPFVIRTAKQRFLKWTLHRFPRPNQLYGEDFEIDLKAAWEEQMSRQITYSKAERYRASAWRGELAQAQHTKFVIDQIKRRPKPHHGLLGRMLSEDVLSMEVIRSHFSDADAERAKQYCAALR